MTRKCKIIIIFSFLFFFSYELKVFAKSINDEININNRTREISQNIRCLVCQNQSIDESNSELAKDLKILIREKLINEIKNSFPEGTIAVFPTAPFSATKSGQDDESLVFYRKRLMQLTSIAGMTSRPQISIPKLKDKTGPVGISLLGWQYSDEILLNKLIEI